MKAISGRYGMAEATVAAIAAGCDAVLMCGADQDRQARRSRRSSMRSRRRTLPLKRVEDALSRHRRVKERFLCKRATAADGRALRARAGPRRASGSRRRNGAVRLTHAQAARPAPGRPRRHRRARQPVRRATSSTPASRSFARSASSRSTTRRVFARDGYLAGSAGAPRRRAPHARGTTRRSPRIIAARGGYGSVQMLPLLDAADFAGARRRRSSVTAITRRCWLADADLRDRHISRSDDRGTPRPRRRPDTTATVSSGAFPSRNRSARSRIPISR